LLLDQEASYRRDRLLHFRLRYARLRHQAAVENVDYRAACGLDRVLFQKLTDGACIDAHENLMRADRRRQKLAPHQRSATNGDNRSNACPSCSPTSRSPAATAAIGVHLLILSGVLSRSMLRRVTTSSRFSKNATVADRRLSHELIGDLINADATLDRIVHNAHRIDLTGNSLRRSRATKAPPRLA
jgi:DNA replication protein DnaC